MYSCKNNNGTLKIDLIITYRTLDLHERGGFTRILGGDSYGEKLRGIEDFYSLGMHM